MSDRMLQLTGADLALTIEGEGPLVVSAHGLSSSRAGDDAMRIGYGPLAAHGRRVLRYDARGHGFSTGRAEPGDYTWPALAGDLIALLDDVDASEPVDATGASMGTGTLLHALVAHPERFRRVVLTIPPTAWETRAAQAGFYEQAADLIERQGMQAWVDGVAAAPLPPVLAVRGVGVPSPQVPEALFPSVLRGAARSDLPSREAIATLRQPALILAWVDDPAHPLSTAHELAELLPDASLVVARDADEADTFLDRAAAHLAG